MLYSINGQYPTPIPFRIKLADGRTRTDPSTFTVEEIASAGYTEVPDMPIVTSNQVVYWSTPSVEWVVRDKTQGELDAEIENKNRELKSFITSYRNELIEKGFMFNGVMFDSRPEDQKRISGAALLAFIAISQGAQIGDLLWHNQPSPFTWIAQDNTPIEMDAYTVIAFGKAAAEHERSHIFAARVLKDMNPIPEDIQNPSYWP